MAEEQNLTLEQVAKFFRQEKQRRGKVVILSFCLPPNLTLNHYPQKRKTESPIAAERSAKKKKKKKVTAVELVTAPGTELVLIYLNCTCLNTNPDPTITIRCSVTCKFYRNL